MPTKRKPTPKQLEKVAQDSEDSSQNTEQYVADLKLLDPDDRRKRIQAMKARNPKLKAERLAYLFGVSEDTIYQDMMALREAARQRFAGDPDLRVDLFGPFEAIRDASLADATAVDVESQARTAHRRNALTAHEKLLDIMFRCGYIAEAPKRVSIGQDPDLGAIQHEHNTPAIERLAEAIAAVATAEEAGSDHGEPDGD